MFLGVFFFGKSAAEALWVRHLGQASDESNTETLSVGGLIIFVFICHFVIYENGIYGGGELRSEQRAASLPPVNHRQSNQLSGVACQ